MNLDRNLWYVRLFFWSLDIWENCRTKWRSIHQIEMTGTNLCFFIRVIIIYMPLVLLLHAISAIAAIVSLTILPIYLFGVVAYLKTLIIIMAIDAFILMLIWKQKRKRMMLKKSRPAERPSEETKIPKDPGFFRILWLSLVSAKKKICPLITFSDTNIKGARQ